MFLLRFVMVVVAVGATAASPVWVDHVSQQEENDSRAWSLMRLLHSMGKPIPECMAIFRDSETMWQRRAAAAQQASDQEEAR